MCLPYKPGSHLLQSLPSLIVRLLTCGLPSAVSKEDKEVIRSRLVNSILNEHDNRLALQAALVIAKIARYEFPLDWPRAITDFVDAIGDQNIPPFQLARALLALLHIVKELSTARLARARGNLLSATPQILAVVGNVYAQLVRQWQVSPNSDQMNQSLLAIKMLRRLLISGYDFPNRDANVTSFWSLSLQQLDAFLQMLNNTAGQLPEDVCTLLGRHALQLSKLHYEMAKENPTAFALLPNSVDMTGSYWALIKSFGEDFGSKEAVLSAVGSATIGINGDAADEKPLIERIALKGLLILRACVKVVHSPAQAIKYRASEDKEEKKRAREVLGQSLLTDDFVREVMEVVMTRFFVFRPSDLREWQEEPEEWEKREEGDSEDFEFSVRSCSEKLFLDLAINYKSIILDPLLNVFYSVASAENNDILFKDSVYTAIGISASVLYEKLDFDAFVRDVLVAEVQKSLPGYSIIRRRAAIILGQWIAIKVSQESRPIVYQIFLHLLNTDDPLNDQVVRVTAGRQFQNIAADWEFTATDFLPFADSILTKLMQLIGEVELIDTKMALLNTISVIVEHVDQHITPYAERIVNLLPGLWDDCGEENLMKQAILTVLTRLVNAMKAESLPLHSMVFPIIQGAVKSDSETQLYLLEEVLELWAAILVQTPSDAASSELLDLVQYLFPIYEFGSDDLRKALEITESYILLAPQYMLSEGVRKTMFVALSDLLGSLRPDVNGLVCNLIETVLRVAKIPEVASPLPTRNNQPASYMILQDLAHASNPDTGEPGFFPKLLQGLHGSWTAHCTTGPNAKDPPVDGIVETDYFSILARGILGSPGGFFDACTVSNDVVFSRQQPMHILLKWLLEEWFMHFENVGDPSRRKLMCLALTKLLETPNPFSHLDLQSFMTIWTDVVSELREDQADGGGGDALIHDQNGIESGMPETPEDRRRRQLTASDDVHTINLVDFIKWHLNYAIEASGGNQQFQEQWLANVDKDVVKAFSDLGIM